VRLGGGRSAETLSDGSRGHAEAGASSGMSAADGSYAEQVAARAQLRSEEVSGRSRRGRGWLVRRLLLVADLLGLVAAFALAEALWGAHGDAHLNPVSPTIELLVFLLTLPGWVVMAKVYGLYDRDEERTDHSTVDDLVGVFHLVTVGTWLVLIVSWATGLARPNLPKVTTFWLIAVGLVTIGRVVARSVSRRFPSYIQNTIVVGAGDVGQLIARKVLQHPEYGLNLLGFVDDDPRQRRTDLGGLTMLGTPDRLAEIVHDLRVERIIFAFSRDKHERLLALVRSLGDRNVQIDIIPRLYEIVGPRASVHTLEGIPLVGLPPIRLSPSSRLVKRTVDLVLSVIGLAVTAPLFAYIAFRIRRDSPGPVFFRQTRCGMNQRSFTALKFRTMYVGSPEDVHRNYIEQTIHSGAVVGSNGLYKLERTNEITPFGRWLRKTSLDELPQLINILRGEMSLVGPRPCIPYETEYFAPHHFERFLVPQGLTGLWQVTARARSTFGEALDLDVAYARGWSLWLDLKLLFRTPLAVMRQRGAA
jgi:exopolysaccharide biosynthesis polyprenyl glycosylphosphotransferase